MLKYILPLCLLLGAVSCSSEEDIKPKVNVDNAFVIEDNPNDSVLHERYLIYKDFGVPVYFNDTLRKWQNGTDAAGRPLVYHERLDMNWGFTDYNHNLSYNYKYLTNPADQMASLRFVREYLAQASAKMRPFSILLADTLTLKSNSNVEYPLYRVGYRTLVFAQLKNLTSKYDRQNTITTVIQSMIADRVKSNQTLCDRFAEVTAQKGWYKADWKDYKDLCPTIVKYLAINWTLSPNVLYDEPPFSAYNHEDFITVATGPNYNVDYYEAIDARKQIVAELASMGFLRGWSQGGSWAPAHADEDREYYLQALLYLGDGGFRRRYGNFPLVMQKYELLYQFISSDLGVNLDYDNLADEE